MSSAWGICRFDGRQPCPTGPSWGPHAWGTGQPFTLLLRSIAGRPLVRCVSPIGRWSDDDDLEGLREAARTKPIQISILEDERDETKTVSAEAEVLLKPTGSRLTLRESGASWRG